MMSAFIQMWWDRNADDCQNRHNTITNSTITISHKDALRLPFIKLGTRRLQGPGVAIPVYRQIVKIAENTSVSPKLVVFFVYCQQPSTGHTTGCQSISS